MSKLRPFLLNLLAVTAVFAALCPLCLAVLGVVRANYPEALPNYEMLPYALFYAAVYSAGCVISRVLSMPNGILMPLAHKLSKPEDERRFILRASKLLSLLFLIPAAIFAWLFCDAAVGVKIIHAILSFVIYIITVRSGADAYDKILSPAMITGGIICLVIAGIIGWLQVPDLTRLIPAPVFFFLFAAVMVSGQSNIDRALFAKKRVSSALPKNIRRFNSLMVMGISALALVLYMVRGLFADGIVWCIDLIKKLIGYVITFIWSFAEGGDSSSVDLPAGAPETQPLFQDDGGGAGIAANMALYAIILIIAVFLTYKIIRSLYPALKWVYRKLSGLLTSFLDRKSDAISEENGFTDTYEELDSGSEAKRRRFAGIYPSGPRLSELNSITDLSERLRFIYRLTLHTLSRKHTIKPSDTTGIVLAHEPAGELVDITVVYDKLRYGTYNPEASDLETIKGKYISLKKTIK